MSLLQIDDTPRIHTHDRIAYKRCRRLWNWTSLLREGLEPIRDEYGYLWYGSGWHFAKEDFHGYHKYEFMADAFTAYVSAHRESERPDDWRELWDIGRAMCDYYQFQWLPSQGRDRFKTLWVDGEPQVEVYFEIPLQPFGVDAIYAGTFDAVTIDEYGRLWLQEYKSYARFDPVKLETDPQISSYCWAAELIYGREFEGMIFEQARKVVPTQPVVLKKGALSQSKSYPTTYILYHNALMNMFGKIPSEYNEHLAWLAAQEDENGDLLVKRDVIRRNKFACENEVAKIVREAEEIVHNPYLYPNPTWDCGRCFFRTPCIAMDDGGDFEDILAQNYRRRLEKPLWRERLLREYEQGNRSSLEESLGLEP